ncbi:NAD(P)-dependent dehydrogenase (short-subunit alcohol dehydrogenase family) [Sphingobium fontiphilum]|uniref:NAD(P)-dependent dehydrogenase (Short-subunit alcohol dehydrogenase family) n=1 Tax=Sphingobium fontiphilum TaxID=944425 RepID=A0A7W6DGE8_9SPHN|nr:SDR family oxidoreductase [Sphingobium fontiphilum]MBB3982825.1 NAD(P)-dependent dehydrogenase (short-subunit alcohol dehydrogenase family) [Sphingobium fontiphilum]
MRRLENKVAVISGTSGGIGAATARRLASEGASVVLADINLEGAEKTAQAVRDAGGEAIALHLDLAEEASIKGLIDQAVARYGPIDVLFNNAADTRYETMQHDAAVAFMDADLWDSVFRINTRGTMLMIKHTLPHMIRQGGGSIINTSSGASLRADLFRVAYASSKAAINVLTEYVAAQYGKKGIRCNVVSPGLVVTENTEMNQGHNLDLYLAHHLTPRLGRPDDLAAMVALLASDDGKFITAQIIPVDGGISTHFPHVAETRGGVDAYKPVKN